MSRTSTPDGSMVITTSASTVAAPMSSATIPPAAAKPSTAVGLTSYPLTGCPARTRLRAIGRPILPRPRKPIRVISILTYKSIPRLYSCRVGKQVYARLCCPPTRRHNGKSDIGDDGCEFGQCDDDSTTVDLRKEQLDR